MAPPLIGDLAYRLLISSGAITGLLFVFLIVAYRVRAHNMNEAHDINEARKTVELCLLYFLIQTGIFVAIHQNERAKPTDPSTLNSEQFAGIVVILSFVFALLAYIGLPKLLSESYRPRAYRLGHLLLLQTLIWGMASVPLVFTA
jgi:hypothetical protein